MFLTHDRQVLVLCGALLAVCACSTPKSPEKPTPTLVEAKYGLLLEDPLFVPSSYRAQLRLDPSQPEFQGQVDIAGAIAKPTLGFYLNGHELQIASAELRMGGENRPLRVTVVDEDWLYFTSETALSPGPATLQVKYAGTVSERSSFGIFRQKTAEDWYLYSQFEARGARRAFPVLDQPNSKVPWQLTLEVPSELTALSNTPEIAHRELGNGWKLVEFAQGPPMPAYLVAVAVGPFDMVSVGETRNNIPVRVATPRGRGDETAWVVSSTQRLIAFLEDYTGSGYPYAKLDLVSIPATGTFSAMENPGLITYVETLLLSKDEAIEFRQRYASVGAHELAHQWFGNLVTNAWWNDIWLNESFATWAAAKTMGSLFPEWGSARRWLSSREGAMSADRLASARVIREPVATAGDIGAAFDGITYAKGASVLAMFEGWIGEAAFQRSIAEYLRRNAWKSVRAEDFLQAVDEASGVKMSDAFQSFITQPGTPLVHFETTCDDGGVSIKVRQERYLPLASEADPQVVYQIPVCIRTGTNADDGTRQCLLLEQAEGSFEFPEDTDCPTWLVPNAGGTGYYRSSLTETDWERLWKDAPLSEREVMVLSSDLRALVAKGLAPVDLLLQRIAAFTASPNDEMALHGAELAGGIRFQDPQDEKRYNFWLQKHLGRALRRIGRKDQDGDGPLRRELRTEILGITILRIRDRLLVASATNLAEAYLSGQAVNPNQVDVALKAMARGKPDMTRTLIESARKTENRGQRTKIFQALGSSEGEEQIATALAVLLDPDFDVREPQGVFTGLAGSKIAGQAALQFLIENVDALRERYGEEMQNRLTRVVAAQCSAEDEAAIVTLLDTHFRPLEGGELAADQALEAFRLCVAGSAQWKLPKRLP